jgi:1-acyl-sn-glycerol-3-phosphate acyltransferase
MSTTAAISHTRPLSLGLSGVRDAVRVWTQTGLASAGVLGTLCVYDVLLRLASPFPDEFYHQISSDMARNINRALARTANITNRAEGLENITDWERPYVIVSNHQSMFDITLISDHLARLMPRYISKIELAKNIPGVSFNLRRGGSACIDRKNPAQAVEQIEALAKRLVPERVSVVIFPEGTRSKTGKMKSFRESGLKAILRNAPGVKVLPLTLTGGSKVFLHDLKPIGTDVEMRLKVHAPIDPPDLHDEAAWTAFVRSLEQLIQSALPPEEQGGIPA